MTTLDLSVAVKRSVSSDLLSGDEPIPSLAGSLPLITRSMLHTLIGQETDVLAVSRRLTDELGVVEIVLRVKAPIDGAHDSAFHLGHPPSTGGTDVRVPKTCWRFPEL
jgi:hypothetical protein